MPLKEQENLKAHTGSLLEALYNEMELPELVSQMAVTEWLTVLR